MGEVAILIPAAGGSTRMRGSDKLMEPVGGEPQLRRIARMARATSPLVIVTLPEGGPYALPRKSTLGGLQVRARVIQDAHEGLAASLRAGVRAAGALADGLMVVPGDMPELQEEDLALMIAVFRDDPQSILRATTADYTPGHPVVFPSRLFGALAVLTGDQGGRSVLENEPTRLLPLGGQRATVDLDTPEDWAEWRRGVEDGPR